MGDGARAAAPDRRPRGRQRRDAERPPRMQEGGRGFRSDPDGRRLGRGLSGLPRDPQRRARPVQGRAPLPPRGHARGDEGPRDVDDVEVRPHGASLRRREGRRRLQSEDALDPRARGHDPPLHLRDHQPDRAGGRHPRARRGDEPAGDGVDLRHLLDEQGLLRPRRRDREAAERGRLARPREGDRARGRVLRPRGAEPQRPPARRGPRRGPGLRQRRPAPRTAPRGGRREDRRGLGLERRRPQPERALRRRGRGLTRTSMDRSPASRTRTR